MSTRGKDLVFALLMLDLKYWGVRMKDIWGCQDEVYLVVNLPIRGMPGCCPRQLVGVESDCKGKSVALCDL